MNSLKHKNSQLLYNNIKLIRDNENLQKELTRQIELNHQIRAEMEGLRNEYHLEVSKRLFLEQKSSIELVQCQQYDQTLYEEENY
jgi:hypothetical protein